MELYKRIRTRREELGLTQSDLAQKMGYDNPSTISKIESGKNDIPQSKIVAFADALDTTPTYLMGWTDKPEKTNIGKRIRERRESLGLSTKDVADFIGIPEEIYHKYESAEVNRMHPDKLNALANALETTTEYLMGWSDEMIKPFLKNEPPEVLLLRRNMRDMTPEERKKMLNILRVTFDNMDWGDPE